jgi:hypothetical protein
VRSRASGAKKLGQNLLDNCCGVVGQLPLYKDGEYVFLKHASNLIRLLVTFPYRASHQVTKMAEGNHENVHKLEAYVKEMASADQLSGPVDI